MEPSGQWQQQVDRWRHAWALSVAGLSALMLLWVPVGRRITTDRNLLIDAIDSATMPGLILRAGSDGHTTLVRVLAGVAAVAVIGGTIATYVALRTRLDKALVVLGYLARSSTEERSSHWGED